MFPDARVPNQAVLFFITRTGSQHPASPRSSRYLTNRALEKFGSPNFATPKDSSRSNRGGRQGARRSGGFSRSDASTVNDIQTRLPEGGLANSARAAALPPPHRPLRASADPPLGVSHRAFGKFTLAVANSSRFSRGIPPPAT